MVLAGLRRTRHATATEVTPAKVPQRGQIPLPWLQTTSCQGMRARADASTHVQKSGDGSGTVESDFFMFQQGQLEQNVDKLQGAFEGTNRCKTLYLNFFLRHSLQQTLMS